MTPSPILKVLSSLRKNGVRYLLMGGQACVVYGGAEFSRDTDIVVVADHDNLRRLEAAVAELQAEVIAIPPFEAGHLQAGLAVHFRCHVPEAAGIRLDVMSTLRGLPEFEILWSRRTTIDVAGQPIELLALPDLVTAKKTQREKDWPMITRLLEAHWMQTPRPASDAVIAFWLSELRTPNLLIQAAADSRDTATRLSRQRPLLTAAIARDEPEVRRMLQAEQEAEQAADRAYWQPRKQQLEALRLSRRND